MVKALIEVPRGIKIFIDTNIFHLYLRGPELVKNLCTQFLERVEKGELIGYTSTLVLDELAYKLMLRRIEDIYRRNPLNILKERREVIAEVSSYIEEGLDIVMGIENLQILRVEKSHLEELVEYMRKYLLMPRDSLHLAVMTSINCTDIASADRDFDNIPFITRWSPI